MTYELRERVLSAVNDRVCEHVRTCSHPHNGPGGCKMRLLTREHMGFVAEALSEAGVLHDPAEQTLADLRSAVLMLPAITAKTSGGFGPPCAWASPDRGYVLCDDVLALLTPKPQLRWTFGDWIVFDSQFASSGDYLAGIVVGYAANGGLRVQYIPGGPAVSYEPDTRFRAATADEIARVTRRKAVEYA